jgi:hypothetical protein
MKTIQTIFTFIYLSFSVNNVVAQTPASYVQGNITLSNGTKQEGFIKNNLAQKGTIQFIAVGNTKKTTYDGTELSSVNFDNNTYQCISGDFFKIICTGKICFLQKASKTSSKILYSGSTPIGVAGTNGKLGDYYIYNNNNLQLLTKKNVQSILIETCKDCTNPLPQVNTNDLLSVGAIVTAYNNCK